MTFRPLTLDKAGSPFSPSEWFAVSAATIAVVAYICFGIGRSIWLDEANSILIAAKSYPDLIDALAKDGNPPLYYFILKAVMALGGSSEIAVRLPSALAYLCGIAAAYCLASLRYERYVGVLSAAFFAVSPVAGRQAQNARMFTLLALITIVSTISFFRIENADKRTRRSLALHGAIATMGLFTHYWFSFVLLAQALWIALHRKEWAIRDLGLLAAFSCLPFLLWLPIFLEQLGNASASWQRVPAWPQLVDAVWRNFWIGPYEYAACAAATAFFCVFGGWKARRSGFLPTRPTAFCLLAAACALFVPFLISLGKPIFYANRYTIIALPFLAVLAAVAVAKVPRILGCLLVGAVTLNCVWTFVGWVRQSNHIQKLGGLEPVPLGDRPAAEYIFSQLKAGDHIIYTSLSRAAIEYYLQRFQLTTLLEQHSFPAEFASHLGWLDTKRSYHREPAVQEEARALVAKLTAAPRGTTFFVFCGNRPDWAAYSDNGAALADLLTAEMDKHFVRAGSQRFVGSFFSEVREYRLR